MTEKGGGPPPDRLWRSNTWTRFFSNMGAVNNSMFYRERVAFLRAIGVEVIARAFEVPVLVASLLLVSACTSGSPEMDVERLQEFGTE